MIRRAGAVVTDGVGPGGHTPRACGELGVPAVTGTGNASSSLEDGQIVSVSCAQGDEGYVYRGPANFKETVVKPEDVAETHTGIVLNMGSPEAAMKWWNVPSDGICPARTEFIISNLIRIHPLALIRFDEVEDKQARDKIADLTRGYEKKPDYFVDLLAQCIAQIAASQHPQPVIVRFSDLRSDQHRSLIGGRQFESHEENPTMGLRGASRYLSDLYRPAFELECRALRRVREDIGLTSVGAMIPFCRTPEEADVVQEILGSHGLSRSDGGFQVHLMIEVPSNIAMADEFAARFDALLIATGGLARLATASHDDSGALPHLSEPMMEAVPKMVLSTLSAAHERKIPVGFCGLPLGDYPDLIDLLVGAGIDFVSVSPYGLIEVIERVAQAERHKMDNRR
jgi:pyruvate,water dikinase